MRIDATTVLSLQTAGKQTSHKGYKGFMIGDTSRKRKAYYRQSNIATSTISRLPTFVERCSRVPTISP